MAPIPGQVIYQCWTQAGEAAADLETRLAAYLPLTGGIIGGKVTVTDGTALDPTYDLPTSSMLAIDSRASSGNASGNFINAHFLTKQTVATTGTVQGAEAFTWCSHTSGTVPSAFGLVGNVSMTGAGGTITNAFGVTGGLVCSNGTVTNAYSLYAGGHNAKGAGAVITNAYGVRCVNPNPSSGGSIANVYGLYIDSLTSGSTLNYAIYTNDGLVHFGDRLEVLSQMALGRTLASGTMLRIKESATFTSALSFENRNSTRVWSMGVDAAVVDDGKFVISDDTAGAARLTIDTSGLVSIGSLAVAAGDITLSGGAKIVGNIGFQGSAAIAKPTITGSKGANAALTSLLSALATYGLITDSTS